MDIDFSIKQIRKELKFLRDDAKIITLGAEASFEIEKHIRGYSFMDKLIKRKGI